MVRWYRFSWVVHWQNYVSRDLKQWDAEASYGFEGSVPKENAQKSNVFWATFCQRWKVFEGSTRPSVKKDYCSTNSNHPPDFQIIEHRAITRKWAETGAVVRRFITEDFYVGPIQENICWRSVTSSVSYEGRLKVIRDFMHLKTYQEMIRGVDGVYNLSKVVGGPFIAPGFIYLLVYSIWSLSRCCCCCCFFRNLESPTPTTMRNGVYAEYSRTIFVAVDCLDRSVQFRIECNQAIQNWSAVLWNDNYTCKYTVISLEDLITHTVSKRRTNISLSSLRSVHIAVVYSWFLKSCERKYFLILFSQMHLQPFPKCQSARISQCCLSHWWVSGKIAEV